MKSRRFSEPYLNIFLRSLACCHVSTYTDSGSRYACLPDGMGLSRICHWPDQGYNLSVHLILVPNQLKDHLRLYFAVCKRSTTSDQLEEL